LRAQRFREDDDAYLETAAPRPPVDRRRDRGGVARQMGRKRSLRHAALLINATAQKTEGPQWNNRLGFGISTPRRRTGGGDRRAVIAD